MHCRLLQIVKGCSLALALSLTVSAFGGQIVDRVVSNVNGHVLLQSDWEEEVAFELFLLAAIPIRSRPPNAPPLSIASSIRSFCANRFAHRNPLPPMKSRPRSRRFARKSVRSIPDAATDAGWPRHVATLTASLPSALESVSAIRSS